VLVVVTAAVPARPPPRPAPPGWSAFPDGGRGSRGRRCRRPGGPAHLTVAPLAGGPRRGSAPRSRGSLHSTERRGPPSRSHSLRPRSDSTCITTGAASAPSASPPSPDGAARTDEPSRPAWSPAGRGRHLSPRPVTAHATAGTTPGRPPGRALVVARCRLAPRSALTRVDPGDSRPADDQRPRSSTARIRS
jgi:hypothetical protein